MFLTDDSYYGSYVIDLYDLQLGGITISHQVLILSLLGENGGQMTNIRLKGSIDAFFFVCNPIFKVEGRVYIGGSHQ